MSTSSIMHHHTTPYAAAAAVVVAAVVALSFGSLSLPGSDPSTNIGPSTPHSVGGQFKYPPVGGGHLTGG